MYLKSLQLVGFKSFAERTALEFLPGVTAIVGPNGCGKSNIADAIRWVLGEQSAKALRGSEMADVIFNGTDGRKPINVAEVSMTFADVDPKSLSLPGVNLDYSEITITRRVHRDGQGEYFINKTPCRLRDIQSLFMDTGMGRSSYSLMAQGQIDQILSAHPEDRRNIFEEAAGINKYKHQKKEALRKLEYTEENLVRLADVIREVKRQIISLQRQAGKARRYKELFDQLKTLESRLARHKFDRLQAEIGEYEAQLRVAASETDQFAAEIAAHETQIADLRRALAEIDQAIQHASNQDHERKAELERHQQRVTTNNERIVEHQQLIDKHEREIAGNEEKIRVQEETLARLTTDLAQVDDQLAAEQARLADTEAAAQRIQTLLAEQNRLLDQQRAALLTVEGTITGYRNELAALDHKKRVDITRTDKLAAERQQLEDQRQQAAQRRTEFNAGLATLRESVATLRNELAARESALEAVQRQLTEQIHNLQTASTALAEKRARWEVLQQFFASSDGRMTLGAMLEMDGEYGAAIEAALGAALRTVLADDLAAARALLANATTPALVAAPDLVRINGDAPAAELPAGARAWAADVVRIRDARFGPLLQSLLHGVLITDNVDTALMLRQQYPHLPVATLAGEFLSAQGTAHRLVTSHIAELHALRAAVEQLDARVTALATSKRELEQKRAALEQEQAALRQQLHLKEVELAGQEGVLHTLTTAERDLDSKIHTVLFELEALAQQDAEERQRRNEIFAACTAAEAQQAELNAALRAAQQTAAELETQREQLGNQLTELKIAVGGIQHQRAALQTQREPIASRLRELRERMETCRTEIETYRSRIEQFRQEIAASEEQIASATAARAALQQTLAGYQHQRQEVATAIEQAEAELKELRGQATAKSEQKQQVQLQLERKRMEVQTLKDRIFQKYQLNVEDLPTDAITITVADQGPAITEQVPRDTDWEAVEQQVAELQSKLDAMGPVNTDAIQEYDELEQRFKFLTQQHDDLVRAKEQLLQVISRINSTTKQLFNETFEKIRVNFQTMFTELFGGGKANLLLLDETDPLESGIEIVAKPPGKQLQSITLLSGGERALTATALLFAIYAVKPSPFCVLDELDAPLDESNINRFIRILQRFVAQSQFIIVSHNKRTIGMADALYGITMEEHGVSKVVSVKFSPKEELERRRAEQAREAQEDRIDGAATAAVPALPHEEDLHNDLLAAKEASLAPIQDAAPVVPEQSPTLGQPPPEEIKAEVQAVVAEAEAVAAAVEQTVAAAAPAASAHP